MNTLTPQSRGEVGDTNHEWLNFSALKDASLVAGGVSLAFFGLVRRSPWALVAGGLGAWVAAKAATNWIAKEEGTEEGLSFNALEEVSRATTIRSSVDEVFQHIENMAKIPLFLPLVKLVNTVSPSQAIWTLKAGVVSAMLDVGISPTDNTHLKLIMSHNGKHLGECNIFLTPVRAGRETRVTMRLRYHPLLGGLANGVVKPVMTAELDTYLSRLKQLMETGEIARSK